MSLFISTFAISVCFTAIELHTRRAFAQEGEPTSAASKRNSTYDWFAEGEGYNDGFGANIAEGDFNSDGYSDLVVGAASAANEHGRIYVFSGGTNGISSSPVLTLTGPSWINRLGLHLANAGDLNGDHYDDLSTLAADSELNSVHWVFTGGPSGLSITPAITLTSSAGPFELGFEAAGIGDINGDGYADLGVSGVDKSNNPSCLFVYLGSPDGISNTPEVTLTQTTSQYYSHTIAGVGDINYDGFDDFLVGAPGVDVDNVVYLYWGNAQASPEVADVLTSNPGEMFGLTLTSTGDLNNDGFTDIVIGAPYYGNKYRPYMGKVYVYLGDSTGLFSTPAMTLTTDIAYHQFGGALASNVDLNKDGFNDLAVGAIFSQSRVYVYFGNSTGLSTTAMLTLTDSANSFGYAVKGIHDINADGYSDLVVGAPQSTGPGMVFLYYGRLPRLTPTPTPIPTSTSTPQPEATHTSTMTPTSSPVPTLQPEASFTPETKLTDTPEPAELFLPTIKN